MRLILMTDLEGCAGVLNSTDWCTPGGRYYENGKALLTEEVNAAIRGFMENGFEEILVLDGHGPGGLNLVDLDPRVKYQRGFAGPYPVGITSDYDAMAFVGQHAKASTPYAHLPHSSAFCVVDQRINGISVGEFGQVMFMGAALEVPTIFGSGDKAFCAEASDLCPNIHTVCVKEGLIPGHGFECLESEYRARNTAAIHVHPQVSRQLIYEGACKAAKDFMVAPAKFQIEPPKGPIKVEIVFRTDRPGIHETKVYTHETDLIAAWNKSWVDM